MDPSASWLPRRSGHSNARARHRLVAKSPAADALTCSGKVIKRPASERSQVDRRTVGLPRNSPDLPFHNATRVWPATNARPDLATKRLIERLDPDDRPSWTTTDGCQWLMRTGALCRRAWHGSDQAVVPNRTPAAAGPQPGGTRWKHQRRSAPSGLCEKPRSIQQIWPPTALHARILESPLDRHELVDEDSSGGDRAGVVEETEGSKH